MLFSIFETPLVSLLSFKYFYWHLYFSAVVSTTPHIHCEYILQHCGYWATQKASFLASSTQGSSGTVCYLQQQKPQVSASKYTIFWTLWHYSLTWSSHVTNWATVCKIPSHMKVVSGWLTTILSNVVCDLSLSNFANACAIFEGIAWWFIGMFASLHFCL